jgi:hypothetical protein
MLQQNIRANPSTPDIKLSLAFVVLILAALIAFEIFNYTTTDHALSDLLGPLSFAGVRWATILALAFCAIDFAGIARLFTPEQGADEPKEVWYLFGAWLLAATMNAVLTWWGVSMAVASHPIQSSAIVDPKTISTAVPLFVAIMVWVIRILIIGSLSIAMDRLLHPGADHRPALHSAVAAAARGHASVPAGQRSSSIPASLNSAQIPARPAMQQRPAVASNSRGARSASSSTTAEGIAHPEPTYHSVNSRR